MIDPVFRALETSDLQALADAEREVLDPPWSPASLETFVTGRRLPDLAPGVWIGGELAGYALAAWMGDRVELYRLGVRARFRRRGLARSLVASVVDAARRLEAPGVDLELRADNATAAALYVECGFREVGRRVGYYRRDGESVDALLMSLELDDFPREPDRPSR